VGNFHEFVKKEQALIGFNLTEELYHTLFASMDVHKKGYMDLTDWISAFGTFKWSD
jgi:Ca2+-binding EF-hand superfamily protein